MLKIEFAKILIALQLFILRTNGGYGPDVISILLTLRFLRGLDTISAN